MREMSFASLLRLSAGFLDAALFAVIFGGDWSFYSPRWSVKFFAG